LDELRAVGKDRIPGQVGPYIDWCLALTEETQRKEAARGILSIVEERLGSKFVKQRVKSKQAWQRLAALAGHGS
jgi:hypothetical protein